MLYKAIAYCFPWFIQVKGLVKYGDKSLLHFSVYNAIDLMYVIMQLVIYLLGICLPKFFFFGSKYRIHFSVLVSLFVLLRSLTNI